MGIKQIANEIFKQVDDLKKLLGEDIKKKVDFESYLMDKYVEEEHPLDDMIPDGFNDWLEQTDIQEIIDYGQKYAELIYNERI